MVEIVSSPETRVGKMPKFVTPDGMEICVLCKHETDVPFAQDITERDSYKGSYVEGCGWVCAQCL